MAGPCAKQIVICELFNPFSGERAIGENICRNPQAVCPRGDMPSGEGYYLCRDVCEQMGHAEEVALTKVADRVPLSGWIAYIYGHSYVCNSCHHYLRESGIERIILVRDSVVMR